MKMEFSVVLLLFQLSGPHFLLANHPPQVSGPKAFYLSTEKRGPVPRLLVLESGEPVLKKAPGDLLSRRVYAVYNTAERAWALAITNEQGNFSLPLELLGPGSVVPSDYLGVKTTIGNYLLTPDFTWVSTAASEQYLFILPDRPNVTKKVTFITPLFNPDIIDENLKKR